MHPLFVDHPFEAKFVAGPFLGGLVGAGAAVVTGNVATIDKQALGFARENTLISAHLCSALLAPGSRCSGSSRVRGSTSQGSSCSDVWSVWQGRSLLARSKQSMRSLYTSIRHIDIYRYCALFFTSYSCFAQAILTGHIVAGSATFQA